MVAPPGRSLGRRGGFAALALVASVWFALDRHPPEWDHANHLERAVECARGIRAGDWDAILGHSPFYPPLALCAAGLAYLVAPTDMAAAGAVMIAALGLGMLATYLLARPVTGDVGAAVAALLYGTAPYVVFSTLRLQLDLPLAAMVALALVVIREADGLRHPGLGAAHRDRAGSGDADQAAVRPVRGAGAAVAPARDAGLGAGRPMGCSCWA